MKLFRQTYLFLLALTVAAYASAEPFARSDLGEGSPIKSGSSARSVIYAYSQHGDDHHEGDSHGQEHHSDDAEHHEENMSDHHDSSGNLTDYTADYSFTLIAELVDGKMVYTGVGGAIDGLQNPTLDVEQDAIVEITLVNASPLEHDLVIPGVRAHSEHVPSEGDTTSFAFKVSAAGELSYYCSVPGHKEAGMVGTLHVSEIP